MNSLSTRRTSFIALFALATSAFCANAQVLTFEEAKQRADQGDAFAQAVVALHYQLGWNTEKNPELAAKYALASANAGEPLGQFRLGALMRAGEGVVKDEKQGFAYQAASFDGLAAAQDPYSITATAIMIFQGKVVEQNVPQGERRKDAATLYKKAADMGYAPAQFNYAMALNDGHGTPQDLRSRDKYLQESNSRNYPFAVQWLVENTTSLATSGVAHDNDERGSSFGAGSRRVTKVSMDSIRTIAKKPMPDSVRPVVQEAPENVICIDVSEDQERIAVLTSHKLLTYEGGRGRLINVFEVANNLSEVYFRDGKSSSVLLVNRDTKEISVLNTSDGRLETLASDTQGTPVGYDPATDSVILFTAFQKAGRTDVGGEIGALDLKTGALTSKGAIKTGLRGHVKAFVRDDGELGVVGLYNDAMERIQPIDCFAIKSNGQWVVMPEESAVAGVKKFLRLPQSARQISRNVYGLTEFEASGKRFLLDEMLNMSARAGVLPLDNSPLQTIYVDGFKGHSFKSISSGTVRRIDGLSSSDDGSKLSIWNVNEKWIKTKFAPDHDLFYFNTQRAAMELPPVVIDIRNFESASLPVKDQFVWSTAMSPDGRSVVVMATEKSAIPVNMPDSSLIWPREQAMGVNAKKVTISYPSLQTETIEVSTPVSNPLENTDGQLSVWFRGQTDITVDGTFFFTESGERTQDIESSTTKAQTGKYVLVENSNGWNPQNEYKVSANVTLFHENSSVVGSLQIDGDVESAFPIEGDRILVAAGGTLFVFDFGGGKVVSALATGELDTRDKVLSVCPVSRQLWYREPSGQSLHLAAWDATGVLSESLSLYPQLQGPPVYLTTDGFYASVNRSPLGLHFSDSFKTYPFEQFDLRLNRPDIVLERLGAPDEAVGIAKQLREKRLKRMGVTEEMLKPDFHVPEVEIVGDIPATTEAGKINFSIKASDSKYPLERLKVSVNNVPVNGRDGELLREESKADTGMFRHITGAFAESSTGPQSLERTVPIKLAAGRNKIQVSVLNNAGAESLYANTEINCTAKRPKPTLYAVAMGVSEYSNPDWNLKYAAKDAKDMLAKLKARSGDNYGEVKELLLTDKEVTKESIAKIRDFLSGATIDDTVLMFVAGHGLLDSKYDYYFGTTDIDFNNPAAAGIAFEEFDDLLADLPSLKKSLLIDTCHAGELDDDEKTLLASAGGVSAPLPASNGIAMRSIGTRGMNVKAVEGARGASEWYDRLQGLFVDLRRGSGSTILSSSAGAEYALESSEQQNGLFTYAVLEALDGKNDADTNKDGSVQMSELGEYVKKRVAELTNNKQTPNTRRVNLEGDFALAKTK